MSHDEQLEQEQMIADRRNFLKSAGVTGLGLASATLAAGKLGAFDKSPIAKSLGINSKPVSAAAYSDVDILNFALNLEYLETEFYTVAVTGQNLEQRGFTYPGVGTPGATTGGAKVPFPVQSAAAGALNSSLIAVAEGLLADEHAHVNYLRLLLGKYAVAKPAINLDALGIGFKTYQQFLTLARAFEDTGSSAYNGAAPLISSEFYRQTAVQIASTEAYHGGNLRLLIALEGITVTKTDKEDIIPPPAGKDYFADDKNGLALVRTPSEVLAIVYGKSAAGTSSGGFFPNGVNGTITMV